MVGVPAGGPADPYTVKTAETESYNTGYRHARVGEHFTRIVAGLLALEYSKKSSMIWLFWYIDWTYLGPVYVQFCPTLRYCIRDAE